MNADHQLAKHYRTAPWLRGSMPTGRPVKSADEQLAEQADRDLRAALAMKRALDQIDAVFGKAV